MSIKETGIGADVAALAKVQLDKLSLAGVVLSDADAPAQHAKHSELEYAGAAFVHQKQEVALNTARTQARSSLLGKLAMLPPEARAIFEQRLNEIDGAETIPDVYKVAAEIKRDLDKAIEEAHADRAHEAEHAKQEHLAKQHEFYANDAEYRKATDEIRKEADTRMAAADSRDAKTDALMKEHDIHTSVDDAVAEKREAYEKAKREGRDQEARTLEAEYHKLREQQMREAAEEARRKGLPADVVDQFTTNQTGHADDREKALVDLKKQQDAYLKAYKKYLERDGELTPEEQEQLNALKKKLESKYVSYSSKEDGVIQEAILEIRNDTKEVLEGTKSLKEQIAAAVDGENIKNIHTHKGNAEVQAPVIAKVAYAKDDSPASNAL